MILDPSFEAGEYLFDCTWYGNPAECGWTNYDGGQFVLMPSVDGVYSYCSLDGGAYQDVICAPNTCYTISCWVKSNNDVFNLGIDNSSDQWTLTGNVWQEISYSFTTGTDSLTKNLWFYSNNVCVDDFSICSAFTVGISEEVLVDDLDVVVFPNPTEGVVSVDFNNFRNNEQIEVKVYDLSGQIVYAQD